MSLVQSYYISTIMGNTSILARLLADSLQKAVPFQDPSAVVDAHLFLNLTKLHVAEVPEDPLDLNSPVLDPVRIIAKCKEQVQAKSASPAKHLYTSKAILDAYHLDLQMIDGKLFDLQVNLVQKNGICVTLDGAHVTDADLYDLTKNLPLLNRS